MSNTIKLAKQFISDKILCPLSGNEFATPIATYITKIPWTVGSACTFMGTLFHQHIIG